MSIQETFRKYMSREQQGADDNAAKNLEAVRKASGLLLIGDEEKHAAQRILNQLFRIGGVSDDEEAVMRTFRNCCKSMVTEMERLEGKYQRYAYPGETVLADGKQLLKSVSEIPSLVEFYKAVGAKRDDFLSLAKDYGPLRAFFMSEQVTIFESALDSLDVYEDSKPYIADPAVEETVAAMREIVGMESPYNDIRRLSELQQRFTDAYMEILQEEREPVLDAIERDRARILDALSGEERPEYLRQFDALKDGAEGCDNVSTLRGYADKSNALKLRLLNEIDGASVRRVALKRLTKAASWRVKSEADVEQCLDALRDALLTELRGGGIVDVEL